MLAHSPRVLSGFAKLGGALLQDLALDSRVREAAILRVGFRANASYEVEKHLSIARVVGLTDAELRALRPGEDTSALGEPYRAVLALADELSTDVRASDAVLAEVRRHFSDREVVELVVTIGYYGLVCRVLETLGVDAETVP